MGVTLISLPGIEDQVCSNCDIAIELPLRESQLEGLHEQSPRILFT